MIIAVGDCQHELYNCWVTSLGHGLPLLAVHEHAFFFALTSALVFNKSSRSHRGIVSPGDLESYNVRNMTLPWTFMSVRHLVLVQELPK